MDEIAALAEDYYNKRLQRDALGSLNSMSMSVADGRQAMIDFQVADAECLQAKFRLRDAKGKAWP